MQLQNVNVSGVIKIGSFYKDTLIDIANYPSATTESFILVPILNTIAMQCWNDAGSYGNTSIQFIPSKLSLSGKNLNITLPSCVFKATRFGGWGSTDNHRYDLKIPCELYYIK